MKEKLLSKFKIHFCVLLLIFLLSLQISQTQPVFADSQNPATPENYEVFFDEVLLNQMSTENIAGATVAVVENGELVFAKGYGFANKAEGKPMKIIPYFLLGPMENSLHGRQLCSWWNKGN
jgi:hypothetical protein